MHTDVISSLLEYLKVTSIGKICLHFLFIVLVFATLTASYVLSFHFTSLVTIYQEAHDIKHFGNNIQGSIVVGIKLDQVLQGLIQETHSNRAYVYRYHNGLSAINNIPFFFQSLIYENISPGTSRIMSLEQRLPVAMTPTINSQFVQNKCAITQDMDHNDNILNFINQVGSAKTMIRCPIFMDNGDLFGFIGIDYILNSAEDTTHDAELVKIASDQMTLLFNNMKYN